MDNYTFTEDISKNEKKIKCISNHIKDKKSLIEFFTNEFDSYILPDIILEFVEKVKFLNTKENVSNDFKIELYNFFIRNFYLISYYRYTNEFINSIVLKYHNYFLNASMKKEPILSHIDKDNITIIKYNISNIIPIGIMQFKKYHPEEIIDEYNQEWYLFAMYHHKFITMFESTLLEIKKYHVKKLFCNILQNLIQIIKDFKVLLNVEKSIKRLEIEIEIKNEKNFIYFYKRARFLESLTIDELRSLYLRDLKI